MSSRPLASLRTSRRFGSRALVSLALLCLACQATSLVHLAFVAHAACAEHGELIDARSDGAHAPPSVPAADTAGLSTPDRTVQSHSHDHCTVAATRRDSQRPPAPALLLGAVATARPVRPDADARHRGSLGVLDVAPKASPPL